MNHSHEPAPGAKGSVSTSSVASPASPRPTTRAHTAASTGPSAAGRALPLSVAPPVDDGHSDGHSDDTAAELPKMTSPYRSRHQVTRSISELYSPVHRRSASRQDSTPSLYISPTAGSSTSITSTAGAGAVGGAAMDTALEPVQGFMAGGNTQQHHHHHQQRGKRLDTGLAGFVSGQSSTPASAASAEGFSGAEPLAPAVGLGLTTNGSIPNLSGDSSRRASLLGTSLGIAEEARPHQNYQHQQPMSLAKSQTQLHAALQEEQVKLCQAQSVNTLAEMVSDLKDFSTYSMQYTEDTYNSIIETYLSLQQTVENIRTIVDKSVDLTRTFTHEASSLDTEVHSQLQAFRDLDHQKARIKEMHARIRSGRGKMDALSARVDAVKSTVERWETADAEWQERTRKRLRSIWIVLLGLVAIGLAAAVVQGVVVSGDAAVAAAGADAEAGSRVDAGTGNQVLDTGPGSTESTLAGAHRPVGPGAAEADVPRHESTAGTGAGWDESLRVFDEL
ncbi:hypothetical protein BROUX41_000104 [Berkeleyomyces rouxiae]